MTTPAETNLTTIGGDTVVLKWKPCAILKFAYPRFPLTAPASFPGSGNTWTRHLIQQLTGGLCYIYR